MTKIRKVSDIIFREDLYPRIETSPQTVQKYAEDLSVLPPIEINQHNELIDGWHRWTAYKKNEIVDIPVVIIQTISDMHFLELAIEKNAIHGLQLSQGDKKAMARQIYHITPNKERDDKKIHLARILSVSERTIRRWLGRIDKDTKREQEKKIFDLWLACYTQQEIADSVGVSQFTVSNLIENGQVSEINKTPQANHLTDFKLPVYNVWKLQNKSDNLKHFGNSEITWLDNLLYLYTNPLDIVIDPFAGSGSTINLCKLRGRRYWVGDRKPVVERASEIRLHNIRDGLPKMPRWKDVKLVYLDPPYWRQSQGRYSDDKEDLANMPLEKFHNILSQLIKDFSKKLSDAYIALIIQPTQWNADNKQFTDHIAEILYQVRLPLDMRYSVPYESQQANAQMADWAKENKKCLVLTREIIVWKVD